jgi:hypothetical protein
MMTTAAETMQMPALGEQGEPCAGCGASLASDQRYCLNCGQRRAGPRVDYRHYLAPVSESAATVPPEVTPTTAPEPPAATRDYAPLAAVAGIAILGLMLLVGVLIGKGNNSTPTAAPPQIVRLGGEAEAGQTAKSATGGSKTASTQSQNGKKAKSATGAKTVNGGLTGDAAGHSNATVQASTQDLEELNTQSGDSYEETVKKLPDKIATPGEAPPIDKSKAPGAGSGAETIE